MPLTDFSRSNSPGPKACNSHGYRQFINLSLTFSQTVTNEVPNPFLYRRLQQEYNKLAVDDRLAIHGIIDRKNYNGPMSSTPLEKLSNPERLETLETLYHFKLRWDEAELISAMNMGKLSDPEPYAKAKLFGCIEFQIALDLADAKTKTIPTDPQAPFPV